MKKRRKFLIYPLLLLSLFLVFASSCKKDERDLPNTFTDPRDGTVYKTVTIGEQVWMAENLKYLPEVVSPEVGSGIISYHYVYGYNGTVVADAKATANYTTYGVLYNLDAALAACPTGWHLPSDAEWTELADNLGGESVAGGKLKESGTTHWYGPNTGATNESGFTALPGGYRDNRGGFDLVSENGFWFSATEGRLGYVWLRDMSRYSNYLYRYIEQSLGSGYSVRCLKD